MKREKVDMTKDIFHQSLKLLDKESIDTVELHAFGDCLLLGTELFYYLDVLKDENIGWVISTNGILLGDYEFDKKLLSYSGLIEISVENLNRNITLEEKYEKINNFLRLRNELNSKIKIVLNVFSETDFSEIKYRYDGINWYTKHTWGENDIKERECTFIKDNFFTVLSSGKMVSCCFDAEGETDYGTVFDDCERINKSWRKCESCRGV